MDQRMERLSEEFVEDDGARWTVWLVGSEAGDGLWNGAVEFAGPDGAVLRSPLETRQPNLRDLVYWFGGLSPVYLEGAIDRARGAAG